MMTAGNKTASLESLCAAVGTLLEDDQERFIQYYNLATHSKNGKTIWFYMYEYNENQRIKQNERNRRKREEKRKMEQG